MFQATCSSAVTLSSEQREVVRIQLEQILLSDFFRSSHRCCQFLTFAVEQLLQGRPSEEVKERTVGIEAFHRPPDYDTAQDNVVRGTANEVRKRLAQYYNKLEANGTVTIAVPPGSYVASAEWPPAFTNERPSTLDIESPQQQNLTERHSHSRFRFLVKIIVAVLMVSAVSVIAIKYAASRRKDPIQRVWSAFQKSNKPVLICVPQPHAYIAHVGNSSTAPRQFTLLPNTFVVVGDVYALADIMQMEGMHHNHWHILVGDEIPSQDLTLGPVILIGSYSNPWTLQLTENLRFTYTAGDVIHDRLHPDRQWKLQDPEFSWKAKEDYAVVSRFQNPETGQPVIVIAGLTNLGTEAAGEFITNPELLRNALQGAPKGWKGENFQFVLETKRIGDTPERPTVIAKYFW